jgi:hypothetical protein
VAHPTKKGSAMETIGLRKIWTFAPNNPDSQQSRNTKIRKDGAHRISSYMDLATKIAELQFRNRDFVLMFRGQSGDHRNRSNNTSLKPSIMRASKQGKVPTATTLKKRFSALNKAERLLINLYEKEALLGKERMKRQQILRWSILQHYEVCPTPLLDVTHSLRIASSFASDDNDGEAYLFVIGVPNLSGSITASAEAGIQIVRLSSVCPPTAVRPHIQEGYVLGEYPELIGVDQQQHYKHFETDFGRRLVAKFKFNTKDFRKNSEFPMLSHNALYPDEDDPLYKLTQPIAKLIN